MLDTKAMNSLSVFVDTNHHKENKDGHTANNYQRHDATGESSWWHTSQTILHGNYSWHKFFFLAARSSFDSVLI